MWAMVMKEFQELRRDRRTMAMLVVLPLLLLVVFGYAANFKVSSIATDVYGPQAQQVADHLQDPFHARTVDSSGTRNDAETAVRDNKVDVPIVTEPSGAPVALVDGSSLFAAQSAVSAFNRLGGQVKVESAGVGKGCAFTVRLPLASDEKAADGPSGERQANQETAPRRRRILGVLGDEQSCRHCRRPSQSVDRVLRAAGRRERRLSGRDVQEYRWRRDVCACFGRHVCRVSRPRLGRRCARPKRPLSRQ